MILNNEEKILISKKLENLQALSSAKIFLSTTKRSSQYKLASAMIAVFTLFFISFLLLFKFHLDSFELLQIELLIFIGSYTLFERYKNLFIEFLPKSYKYQVASLNANNQFSNIKASSSKQKIMFFISLDEKYVEILVDEEIAKIIPNSHWQGIVNEFTQDIKENQFFIAYEKAITACGSILIEKFPLKESK
jgi:putative membrane protein